MKRIIPSLLMVCLLFLVWGASAQTSAKKIPQTGTKKKAPVKKSATPTKASSKTAPAKKSASKRPAVTWRNRQLAPTTDRYREIQSALSTKGYLKPEDATGTWNQGS